MVCCRIPSPCAATEVHTTEVQDCLSAGMLQDTVMLPQDTVPGVPGTEVQHDGSASRP